MNLHPDDDSRVRLAPVADPGTPVEQDAPGSTAAEAESSPASRGTVPGIPNAPEPGTAAPSSVSPLEDGAAQDPFPAASTLPAAAGNGAAPNGDKARAEWRRKLAEQAKAQRRQRGYRRAPARRVPGGRWTPPGGAA